MTETGAVVDAVDAATASEAEVVVVEVEVAAVAGGSDKAAIEAGGADAVTEQQQQPPPAAQALAERSFGTRMWEVVVNYLPLAFITFGGPQAHIALLFDLFVTKRNWLTPKVFAEIFAISNALPGPASTQLAYTLALIRGGVVPGVIAFFIWSVPGGLVMTFLGYGVSRLGVGGVPNWILHVENGLASVAVALVAGAAYKLGCKVYTDNVGRIMGILAASLLINFSGYIWLIPAMMVAGGAVTYIQDMVEERRKMAAAKKTDDRESQKDADASNEQKKKAGEEEEEEEVEIQFTYSPQIGVGLIVLSLVLLAAAAALRSVGESGGIPRPLVILGTFYFVGNIIFGGGPVVIPLLYSYVVSNGWLTDSEFIIGVAIINAMPGPNFNFAAYCGALALRSTIGTSVGGGLLAWVGIFLPGILLKSGVLPLWNRYRGLPKVKAIFRGFSAVAVGLVFAATYLLWQKSISVGDNGSSMSSYPFYVAVAACAYVLIEHVKLPPPLVVLLGGVVGAIDYAVTK